MEHLRVFDPLSSQASHIVNLFNITLIICAVIFLIVTVSIIYILFRYGRRSGDDEPPQLHGNRKLETIWTVIPLLIVTFLFGFTVYTMRISDPSPEPGMKPDLVVIGHQWWWEIHYPKSGIITANEIHIPVGKRLLVRLESNDVIHDFWVPQLARKMDMTPGHPTHIWLEADKEGTYLGACSEYCGTQHAWMRFRVIAQPQAEFAKWKKNQEEIPPKPVSGEEARGFETFRNKACGECHRIAGTEFNAKVGPDLTHIASRQMIGAGILKNNIGDLTLWLDDTQSVKPGSLMPDMKLTDPEIDALVAYLESLK